MKTSDSITNIAGALLAAQQEITFAAKDAKNPHYKTTYADLPAVIDAVKPALNKAGIVFLQTPTPSEPGTLALTTRLIHTSGEWIEDTAITPLQKADPQGYGSAITYLRRYSLAAVVGLYQDDDDGNAASKPAQQAKPAEPEVDLSMFAPQIRTKIRATAAAAIQAFHEGNEWSAYEEVMSCLDQVGRKNGEPDEDCRNQVRIALNSIFKPHSALRSALKRMADEERQREKAHA